ncbi:hypothetical protein WH367_16630 [Comamonas sp. MYb21]|uniref:hypothetical protein n=1 Tax=Comamonas sp. MYb21 TaxID=1848648 RepID=UPI003099C26F
MAENNSSAPVKTAGEPFVALGECIADQICLSVAELPDRDSPADWPQAMLVTSDELRNIVLNAISYAAQAVAAQAAPAAVAVPECERCGLSPAEHDLMHWCDNQSFRHEDGTVQMGAAPALPATEDSSAGDLAVVQSDANDPIKEVMELVRSAMDAAMWAGELILDTEGHFDAKFELAKRRKSSIETKLRALLPGSATLAEVQAKPVAWRWVLPSGEPVGTHCFPMPGPSEGAVRLAAAAYPPCTVQYLHDHTAPQAQPADALLLDYLQTTGSTVEIIPGPTGWNFRVGGLHTTIRSNLRSSIDAAMAAAQEGGNHA